MTDLTKKPIESDEVKLPKLPSLKTKELDWKKYKSGILSAKYKP
jgi:hypothetical protein